MQNEYYQIVVAVLALAAAVTVIYLAVKAMNARPDIVALFSLLAISAGFIGLLVPNTATVPQSLLAVVSGCLFLLFAAFTHNRKLNGGAK